MTHAACAMVRKLRSGANFGLLYGQGGFVTKHHALVLSRQAPRGALAQDTSVQTEADRHRRAVPEFVTEANGKGEVESFTVIYGRNGEAEHGVVMLRTQDKARALARVPASDRAALSHLLNLDAARSARAATSSQRTTACWSGGWGDIGALSSPSPRSCGAR